MIHRVRSADDAMFPVNWVLDFSSSHRHECRPGASNPAISFVLHPFDARGFRDSVTPPGEYRPKGCSPIAQSRLRQWPFRLLGSDGDLDRRWRIPLALGFQGLIDS